MTEIAAWLEQLGLAKYAPIFSENEVELADLSELSEDDLKEIGLPLGPRRRILKAVRACHRRLHLLAFQSDSIGLKAGGCTQRTCIVVFAAPAMSRG